jgi:Leucine-rich repeat (LRR) protein
MVLVLSVTTESPSRRRRWFQFSLRSLLIALTVAAVWLGLWSSRAQRQKRAVAAARQAEMYIVYDSEYDDARSAAPEWLLKLLAVDWFADVVEVYDDTDRRLDLEPGESEGIQGTDWLAREMSAFPRLRKLMLSDPAVDDAFLRCVSSCRHLEYLDVTDCRITNAGLSHLTPLRGLKSLNLDGARVDDDGVARLDMLSRLETLSLDRTRVGDRSLVAIGRLNNLETLSLMGTRVTDRGMRHLSRLVRLERLFLNDTSVTDDGVAQLGGLAALTTLNLKGTRATEECLASLVKLRRLSNFVADFPVSDRGIDSLSKLPLKSLSIQCGQVTERGWTQLESMRRLDHLELRGKVIDNAVLGLLVRLPKLTSLELEGTSISPEAAARFPTRGRWVYIDGVCYTPVCGGAQ